MGAIIAGLATFLGINVALGGMPVVGVIIGCVGGIVAGYIMCDNINNR